MRGVFVVLVLVAAALAAPSTKNRPFGSIDFDEFWSLERIYDFLDELAQTHVGILQTEVMGRTAEGREIRAVRVTNEEHLGQETLPIVLVTAGTSARDWISVMAAVNFIHELAEHYDENRHIVDDIEWFIIPVANPDGYEFSRTPGNRAWIKNRVENAGSDCLGVNIERNFNFNWGLLISSSEEPCSSNFRGIAADSEEETKTIQFSVDIMSRIQKAYVTIRAGAPGAHSMVSFPFSSNNELFMPNFREQITVGNLITNNIWQKTGTRYRLSSEAAVLGPVSGTSGDYATGRDNVPLSYTIFAPSVTPNGWDVPEGEINRIVNEIFVGLEGLGEYVNTMPLPPPWE